MLRLPLIDGINKYIKENNIPFTMPGHKSGKGFLSVEEGKIFYENILKGDITEVEGVDNLHNPEDIIKESQNMLSKFYASYKSYYLVNGSTSGNMAMIYATFNKGDKIILERNCHKSIFNAVIMRELEPVYLKNKLHEVFNAPVSLDREHFLSLIKNNKDAKGIVITYPNYYGVCVDLSEIIKEAKKYNMKVLVDCAHGAHFGIIEDIPQNPIKLGADMVVMSSHKTLSSFTQTAYLHINDSVDVEKVDFYVSAFMSTSPSYVLMMSMEFARFYLEKYGAEAYKNFLDLILEYREKINNLQGFTTMGKEHMYIDRNDTLDTFIDLTRLVISLDDRFNSHKLLDYLRVNKIQGEMSDGKNVILIPSVFNDRDDFESLYNVLKSCNLDYLKGDEQIVSMEYNIPDSVLRPFEVMEREKILVDINLSEDKVCAKAIVPYPPGVPLIMPGEVINKQAIELIKFYSKNNKTVMGMKDGGIFVVE
ncbi:aminotransferase class I/II-fold pyridoxal phosphate-dependent enzyme [Hathewaya histolytica]|uniref:aminotransferase class I/II-fold pyridoxal phosphate-dependent enzyme n=1 Tax=Hathewaya histolytica TaxID=1498 RepID=UPI003B685718